MSGKSKDNTNSEKQYKFVCHKIFSDSFFLMYCGSQHTLINRIFCWQWYIVSVSIACDILPAHLEFLNFLSEKSCYQNDSFFVHRITKNFNLLIANKNGIKFQCAPTNFFLFLFLILLFLFFWFLIFILIVTILTQNNTELVNSFCLPNLFSWDCSES